MRKIRVGTRDSRLAMVQTELVLRTLGAERPDLKFELVAMKTTGDRILDRPLEAVGGKGLFVKELDQALLDGRVDICVHSYKDLPVPSHPDLPVLKVARREDARDVLILPEGQLNIEQVMPLGTSSLRRRHQLAELYPEWRSEPVRGNVQTRLRKLDSGEFGGLVLAAAGIIRLGLWDRVSRVFEPDEMLPSACQGILAIQGRKEGDYSWLDGFGCRDAMDASVAERAFVHGLGASCTSPVAAYATIEGMNLHLAGMYVDESGRIVRGTASGNRTDAESLGLGLADSIRKG